MAAGKHKVKDLEELVKDGKGKAELKNVSGYPLWLISNGSHNIQLKDAKGGMENISISDVHQSSGIIDVINMVLLTKQQRKLKSG